MKTTFPPWCRTGLCLLTFLTVHQARAVQISFPANTSAVRGTQINIPTTIGDVTGLGVYSYELQFTFNSNALTVLDVIEAGTLSDPWSANEFHEQNAGSLRIVAAGSTSLSGAGTLLFVRFDLPLNGSGNSDLTWTQAACRLNEGSPTLTFVNGFITITNPPTITLNPNTTEVFAGDSVSVSASGGASPYAFAVLNPAVGAFNQTSPTSGYFRGLIPGITTIQATDNNSISGTSDNYFVRAIKLVIPDSTILSGRMFLMPVNILLTSGTELNPPQQLVASRSVNGPQINPQLFWQQQPGLTYNVYHSANPVFQPNDPGVTPILNVPDELPGNPVLYRYTDTGVDMAATLKTFYVVTASGYDAVPIYSGQFRVTWALNFLTLNNIVRTGTLTENWLFQWEPGSNLVNVSFSNQTQLPDSGTLFYLQFTVVPGSGTANLTMSNALFNEDQTVIYDHGTVTRIAPPTITVSPGSAQETIVGDSIQFSASGGTGPYTWHLTDPATGTVTNNGKFYAQAGGLTYVWVNDVNGFTDSSALVTVDDFRIVAQSTSGARGDSVTLTLQLVGNATGLGVYSTSLDVQVSGTGWTFAYPIQTGTLLNGWLSAYEVVDGTRITFAASNGSPLSGSGTFLQLRGRIDPAASTGNRTIQLNAANLNEGNRRAYRINGTLTITP